MCTKKKFLKLIIVSLIIMLLPIHVDAMNALDAVTPTTNPSSQKNDKNKQEDKAQKEYDDCLQAHLGNGAANCLNQFHAAQKEKQENEKRAEGSGFRACKEYVNGLNGGASTGMISSCSKYAGDSTLTEADFKRDFGINDEVKKPEKENTSEEKGP